MVETTHIGEYSTKRVLHLAFGGLSTGARILPPKFGSWHFFSRLRAK